MGLLTLCFGSASFAQGKFVVHFNFNKSNLTNSAKFTLDSFIKTNQSIIANLDIDLSGHCDSLGTEGYNDQLSLRRVAAVENYLVKYGVPPESFLNDGFGERKPVTTNATSFDRSLNRRVEVYFVKMSPTLKQQIADSSVVVGTNIVLRNINFYGGRRALLPESRPMLQQLLDALNSFPKLVIRIEGHICCADGPGDGLDTDSGIENLSEIRAHAIHDYLVAAGIDPKRLSYKGFGHSAPIYAYPEKSEEERMQNRRVEIKIISK